MKFRATKVQDVVKKEVGEGMIAKPCRWDDRTHIIHYLTHIIYAWMYSFHTFILRGRLKWTAHDFWVWHGLLKVEFPHPERRLAISSSLPSESCKIWDDLQNVSTHHYDHCCGDNDKKKNLFQLEFRAHEWSRLSLWGCLTHLFFASFSSKTVHTLCILKMFREKTFCVEYKQLWESERARWMPQFWWRHSPLCFRVKSEQRVCRLRFGKLWEKCLWRWSTGIVTHSANVTFITECRRKLLLIR